MKQSSSKTIAENRRARFDYAISETLEAGVELWGTEVKSVKTGQLALSGSYALLRDQSVWLINAQIPPYQPKNAPPDYDPARARRLLLHASEIKRLSGKLKVKSWILVPLQAYLKNGIVKIELGLGQSRKAADKREYLKSKTAEREMRGR